MKPKIQMVMQCAKFMEVAEETIVGCALIYHSGKWQQQLFRDDLDAAYQEYLDGVVSTELEDFCLDYMSGRIPPNLLINVLTKLGSQTQKIKRKR